MPKETNNPKSHDMCKHILFRCVYTLARVSSEITLFKKKKPHYLKQTNCLNRNKLRGRGWGEKKSMTVTNKVPEQGDSIAQSSEAITRSNG